MQPNLAALRSLTYQQWLDLQCDHSRFTAASHAESAATAADKASALAKSMYEGVRQRMKQLQTDVSQRDQHIHVLQSELAEAAREKVAQQHQAHADQQVPVASLHMLTC